MVMGVSLITKAVIKPQARFSIGCQIPFGQWEPFPPHSNKEPQDELLMVTKQKSSPVFATVSMALQSHEGYAQHTVIRSNPRKEVPKGQRVFDSYHIA